jgi:zinc/manganese transport system substrate-binding protein
VLRRRVWRMQVTVVAMLAQLALAGCSTASSFPTGSSKVIEVVAAENVWGSIAAQIGGDRVHVVNLVDSPDADPHDYEATVADARAVALADLVLVNGVGYDVWASQLAAASPNRAREELDVGDVVGVNDEANPHRWYNPEDVQKVVDTIAADFKALDPPAASYFDRRETAFDTTATAEYHAVLADIKSTYAGTPVGASESIFSMLAPATGLDLVTPPDFLRAISEGNEPTAADKATVDAQIARGAIKVYVYNSQNATPDVQAQLAAARAHGIPVTAITETMTPATTSWEQWQTAQLVALRTALAKATEQ